MRMSEFIIDNMEPLLCEWELFARELLPADKTLDQAELRDDAETLLRAIARDMESAQSGVQQKAKSKGENRDAERPIELSAHMHAHDRYAIGFDINQLVAEYRAVRASVIRLWTQKMGHADRGNLEELIRFNESIDEILADSVTRYTDIVERAKTLFLAVLGHDLRSPLGAVLAAANVLLRSEDSTDRTVKTAALILRSSTRMSHMVTDLIDFTRTRLGAGVPIMRAPMDLGATLSEVIEEIGIAHPQHTLRSERDGDLRGSWDEGRIKQVLTNLIENAVQYGSRVEDITVTARGMGPQVVLEVHNDGPTIPPQDLARIFEPMVRTGETSSPVVSTNMGLGLYIVSQVVKAHGGTIRVKSTEADGTRFIAQLPRFGT